jgi:uroporphyrin-III C-methyltransferase
MTLIADANITTARPPAASLISTRSPGRVTLVGAGPGDPDLLTLKAVKAIAQATVLLVDDLVNLAVLKHAHPTARVVHVGKRGGCQSTPQAFIERLMVQEALQGEHVVRLKGGDPMLFGRAGEEIEHLQAQGVPVEVVNGITAGLAAATSLNTPLTHRNHAHGVLFVTGHAKPGDAGPDWAALGHSAQEAKLTLVIYMGLTHLHNIQSGLLQSLPAHTPALVVQHATLPHQQQLTTTLGQLQHDVTTHHVVSPAMVLVGDVCAAAVSHIAQSAAHTTPTMLATRLA